MEKFIKRLDEIGVKATVGPSRTSRILGYKEYWAELHYTEPGLFFKGETIKRYGWGPTPEMALFKAACRLPSRYKQRL